MKKQYKSSILKNRKIEKKKRNFFFLWCSSKRLRSLLSYFQILRQKSKKALWGNQVTNDA